jgi:hypothetical protein
MGSRKALGTLTVLDCAKTRWWFSSGRRPAYAVFMAYIEGHARDYALPLPASIEDYVAADSPVRFVDAFVDDLDLGESYTLRFAYGR